MEPRYGGNGRHAITENVLHGGAVTSTMTLAQKQGHLSNLHDLSKGELLDLLQRQMKILKNEKFVEKLPDKGEKVHKFIAELQNILSDQERRESSGHEDNSEKAKNDSTIDDKNPTSQQTAEHSKVEEELKVIERGFANLSVHEGPHYQVVIKAESREQKKSKFSLNRSIKKSDSIPPSRTNAKPKKEPELTSASVHDPSYGPAQMISVDQCRDLYSDHLRKMQDVRAQQIADRVLRRLRLVAPVEHPEGHRKFKEEKDDDALLDSVG